MQDYVNEGMCDFMTDISKFIQFQCVLMGENTSGTFKERYKEEYVLVLILVKMTT